ncbi:MspA family porin [Nocardia sp. XZ_19_385]|uniref:MspA family porin n=1 Tax=Nocardia sp. XZ_19_385 TaxID=2769488 RepID=UPI00188F11E9|nr:MspA family porin [Nocardia sp. XZ_19_385]
MFGKILGTALAATAFGIGQTVVATADTFVPLPGGTITRELADGTTATLSLDSESAKISGSMGATPVHRNVWVTARASVDLAGPSASTATIKLSPGYIVGCQVDIAGITESGNETATASQGAQGAWSVAPAEAIGTGITFGPGKAVARLMLDLEMPDDYGQESHKRYNKVPGPHTSVTWIDETFSVDGCGGYAQARAFVAAEIGSTNFIGNVLLWGQPFSIG